jgi:hypothetical protein
VASSDALGGDDDGRKVEGGVLMLSDGLWGAAQQSDCAPDPTDPGEARPPLQKALPPP